MIIEDFAVRRGIERVDGEVAAGCVFAPVGREGDSGVPSVGRHVAAQRGHLEGFAVDNGRDRAVIDAGRHRTNVRALQPAHDFVGRQGRRDVDVLDRGPSSVLRTTPPTKRASPPSFVSTPMSRNVDASRIHSTRAGSSFRIIRCGSFRRNSPGSQRSHPRYNDRHTERRRIRVACLAIRCCAFPGCAESSRKARGTSNTSATSLASGTRANPSCRMPTTGSIAKPVPVS